MKTEWPIKDLGRVCLPVGTVDPRRTPEGSFRYIDISSICRDSKTIANATLLVGRDAPSRARQVVKAGDVLVSTVRPNLNAVALVPEDLDGEVASTGFCVLRPEPTLALPEYVFYWVRSSGFVDYLVQRATGASYPAVTDGVVKSSLLPLPPLAEQQCIVRILDEADALRRLRSEADRRMEDLVPAVFSDMFGDPATNPKGWRTAKLGACGCRVRYGLGQPPAQSPTGIPMLRATNVSKGDIHDADLMLVDPASIPPSRDAVMGAQDVIVVRSGAYTGDVAQVGDRWEGSIAGYDLIVSPGDKNTGEFVAAYLLSRFVQDHWFGPIKQRAAQPHLNARQVADTPFFQPPLPRQQTFAQRVKAVNRNRELMRTAKHRLDLLFAALLDRAFKGRL